MTCSDAQRVLPEIMDGGENVEFQTHLKSCPTCLELMAELDLIANEARQLAQSDEPPQRLWVKIAAELRSEGLIREQEAAKQPVLAISPARRWRAWWLAPVAAALIVAVAYFSNQRAEQRVADQNKPASTSQEPSVTASKNIEPAKAAQKAAQLVAKQGEANAGQSAPAPASVPTELVSDDGQILSGVSGQPAPMRATFESQLKAVNAYIRDAEAYVRQNPDDEDAKQQLMDAYEQKSLLYQMALDQVQ